jgi:DNA-binding transcriptional ArsR family regulator
MEALYSIRDQKRVETLSYQELKKWSDTFDVLGNPIRLAIVVILYGNSVLLEGKRELTFGQIMSIVKAPSKPALASHLHELIEFGLVDKFPVKDDRNRVYPIYALSAKGKDFLIDFGLKEFIEKRIADTELHR